MTYAKNALGLEKMSFLNLPTPLMRLNRISEDLGVELYIKRDDLTDFGGGGNKLRKLEYFVKDALNQGATMLLTPGGAQTNHGRLTATVASKYGLRSAIVAVDEYPGELSANLLLDGILGCHVYLAETRSDMRNGELMEKTIREVTEEWKAKGEKVYFIPIGGSNEIGLAGYYDCGLELAYQIKSILPENTESGNACGPTASYPARTPCRPRVFTTIGSLGTYMGLLTAKVNEDLPYDLTGVTVMPYKDPVRQVTEKYTALKEIYGLTGELSSSDIDILQDYDFGAYNNAVPEVRDTIRYMARMEGIFLDPCYTGKTFHALLDRIRSGNIGKGETIIFLHTGGFPGLYTGHHREAFEEELMSYIHIV